MDVLDALHTRNSVAQLQEPGPTAKQLDNILKAGLRANDRKHLRPWKFIVIEGDARVKLGELCAESLSPLSDTDKEKELIKPLRAPMIITVVACIRPENKVPDIKYPI